MRLSAKDCAGGTGAGKGNAAELVRFPFSLFDTPNFPANGRGRYRPDSVLPAVSSEGKLHPRPARFGDIQNVIVDAVLPKLTDKRLKVFLLGTASLSRAGRGRSAGSSHSAGETLWPLSRIPSEENSFPYRADR